MTKRICTCCGDIIDYYAPYELSYTTVKYDNYTFYFCQPECKWKFDHDVPYLGDEETIDNCIKVDIEVQKEFQNEQYN